MYRRPVPIALALVTLALAACGGDEEPSSGAGEEPKERTITDDSAQIDPEAAGPEDADPLPRRPAGWGREVNDEAGFAIGVPPGWTARPSPQGQGSVLVSPEELAVISITADRTSGALELPLGEFARRTAEALGSDAAGAGRFRGLEVERPGRFDHAYDAVAVAARGTPRGGEPERVLVVVVRRAGHATYVAIGRRNATEDSQYADPETLERAIASLRGRPAQ